MDIVLSSKCVSVAQLRSERAKVCGKRWRSSNNCPAVIRPHSFRDAAAATDAPQAPCQHPGGQGKNTRIIWGFSRADLLRTCDLCALSSDCSRLWVWLALEKGQPASCSRPSRKEIAPAVGFINSPWCNDLSLSSWMPNCVFVFQSNSLSLYALDVCAILMRCLRCV